MPDIPDTPTSLTGVVTSVAASIDADTILLELICVDAYAAEVLFEDVQARLNSETGLWLTLKVKSLEVTKVAD